MAAQVVYVYRVWNKTRGLYCAGNSGKSTWNTIAHPRALVRGDAFTHDRWHNGLIKAGKMDELEIHKFKLVRIDDHEGGVE